MRGTTLVDLLCYRARTRPDKRAYTFLSDGQSEGPTLTYAQLERQVRAIAARLQGATAPGDRALLFYPQGLDYITAFLGCLYAGVIAVTTYPPRRNRADPRLAAIADDAQAKLVLTTNDILSDQGPRLAQTPALRDRQWLATDTFADDPAENWRVPAIDHETLAFLQYTSGSTGTPKGVMISHGNLLHNLAYTVSIWQYDSESVMVTWLPLFHDMGLILGLLQPIYRGFSCYLMSPATFGQRPARWLQAISHYRATHSAAPNFAYQLCVDRITEEQRATLDLSSWRMSLNGAEPVSARTLGTFNEYFEPCGLEPTTVCHGYGLAEGTLAVAGAERGKLPTYYRVRSDALERHRVARAAEDEPNAQTLVGCGYPAPDAKVIIVDPATLAQCRTDEVGEIWLSGPSVAQGYWQRPVETAETFRAHLADTGEGPFLRTGDLGFLKDGELFVTGRLKDLIIIRGQNHYPQDIERTVGESHESLARNGGAAFSVEPLAVERVAPERLVIVQEVKRTYLRGLNTEAVFSAICRAVFGQHELAVHAIALLKPGRLPKTSSGKVQRRVCRERFLAGELGAIAGRQQSEAGKPPPSESSSSSDKIQTIQSSALVEKYSSCRRER